MIERRIIAGLAATCLALMALVGLTLTGVIDGAGGGGSDPGGTDRWVATDGSDDAPGTREDPWATLQHASDLAQPGTTVWIEAGRYAQRLDVAGSGEPGRPITFAAAPEALVVLDGSSLEVPADQAAMITIEDRRHVAIEGIEITGFSSARSGHVPIGIFVTGSSRDVSLLGNHIHDMGTTFDGRNGGDAHGIAVYGTDPDHAIEDVRIAGNELDHLTLGSSEALVVNGNVVDFAIERNRVHDSNNIGIDVIGSEGVAPDPTVDQARDGVVRGNEVWNIDSRGNPAYGDSGSADGVYVDGGRDVVIEGNRITNVNIGIELASEHAGRATRAIVARNNVVIGSTTIGIAIGGYDRRRGSTEDSVIVQNTVVGTDGPGVLVQFDTRRNVIANNIVVAGPGNDFVENPYRENVANVVDHNLYFSEDGSSEGTWSWKGRSWGDFASWQASSGIDRHSLFADPIFVDATAGDLRLGPNSPAIDAGAFLTTAGSVDAGGSARVEAGALDIGAFETEAPDPSPTPTITEPTTAVADVRWIGSANAWGPPEIDRSNGERGKGDGGPITIGGVVFEHGVGVHAPSRIVLDLGGACTLFVAQVGLDDEVDEQGSVVFTVRGDGSPLATSGVVRGAQPPVPITADVEGIQELTLSVTPAADGNGFDHADWADARLLCAGPAG